MVRYLNSLLEIRENLFRWNFAPKIRLLLLHAAKDILMLQDGKSNSSKMIKDRIAFLHCNSS